MRSMINITALVLGVLDTSGDLHLVVHCLLIQ